MNNGQVALAVGASYLLGRLHKARWALALAGVAAGRRLRSGKGAGGLLKAPAQLGELAGTVRGQLLSAGKKAAVAAASSQIDKLSDRLEDRAASLRSGPGRPEADQEAEDEEPEEAEPEEAEPAAEDEQRTEEQQQTRPRDRGGPSEGRGGRAAARRTGAAPTRKTPERTGAAQKTAAGRTAKKTAAGLPGRRTRGW
ncbi:hypothetical protein [Peterkaempfera bronchialis]|uniref:hypothetical protein n=1 Tax=Peterkaempfera bronchialis TaxID=2126346 RepID=UPI003C2B563D